LRRTTDAAGKSVVPCYAAVLMNSAVPRRHKPAEGRRRDRRASDTALTSRERKALRAKPVPQICQTASTLATGRQTTRRLPTIACAVLDIPHVVAVSAAAQRHCGACQRHWLTLHCPFNGRCGGSVQRGLSDAGYVLRLGGVRGASDKRYSLCVVGDSMIASNSSADLSSVEAVVSLFLPNLAERHLALQQLVLSADLAASIAPAAWGATLARDGFRLNVGRVEVFVIRESTVRFNCIGQLGKPPFVGSNFEDPGDRYKSVPSPKCSFIGSIREFAKVRDTLQPYHQQFIQTVGRKRTGEPVSGSPNRRSHSEELMAYAHAFSRQRPSETYWVADDEALSAVPIVEGSRLTLKVNAFERSAEARARCLEHYGHRCVVCGFTSERAYGNSIVGVIHVHHVRQLADIGKQYVVDPIADLRPVCPNCHAVIHSKDPPFSVDEVACMVSKDQPHR